MKIFKVIQLPFRLTILFGFSFILLGCHGHDATLLLIALLLLSSAGMLRLELEQINRDHFYRF